MQSVDVAEAFHLAFLTVFQTVTDPRSFALKGGGNLRFYFDSLRYSEDIDLDAFASDPRLFTEKVERAFMSPNLAKLLATLGIKVTRLNPKDRTMTKERWVVDLAHRDVGATIHSRVEISHRAYGLEQFVVVEPVSAHVVSAYAPLPAPMIGHYVPRGAVIQKIVALGDRRATQPRDVFDLDHLFRKFPDAPTPGLVAVSSLEGAISRVFEIDYPAYRSKVVPFLDSSIRDALDSMDAWGTIQARVVDGLEAMRA